MKLGFQMSSVTPYLQSVEQLQAACEKVAQMGYEDVQLINTAQEAFGSRRRAAMMMLGDSRMLVGRK